MRQPDRRSLVHWASAAGALVAALVTTVWFGIASTKSEPASSANITHAAVQAPSTYHASIASSPTDPRQRESQPEAEPAQVAPAAHTPTADKLPLAAARQRSQPESSVVRARVASNLPARAATSPPRTARTSDAAPARAEPAAKPSAPSAHRAANALSFDFGL